MAACPQRDRLPHVFEREHPEDEVDRCSYCGITYRDAHYGVGTNETAHSQPARVKKYGVRHRPRST